MHNFVMVACLRGIFFTRYFKVSASKCIFSYAPKISKDLLAKKNHLNSRTRPQAFKGSVKIPMIPWYWAGFLIALKYQGKVWVDHTLFSLWYTHHVSVEAQLIKQSLCFCCVDLWKFISLWFIILPLGLKFKEPKN